MFEKYLLKKYNFCLCPAEASNVTRQGGDGTRPGATPFINDFLVPGQHFTCNNSANQRPVSCDIDQSEATCNNSANQRPVSYDIDQSESLSTRTIIPLCDKIQSTERGGQIGL